MVQGMKKVKYFSFFSVKVIKSCNEMQVLLPSSFKILKYTFATVKIGVVFPIILNRGKGISLSLLISLRCQSF